MTVLEAIKKSKTPTLMHKKSIKAAQDMLQPDETVLWAMTVNVCDHPVPDLKELSLKDMDSVVLVVTDQRIFTARRLIGISTSAFIPLWEVRSVQERIRGAFRCLEITGFTQYLLVEENPSKIRPLHDAISRALAARTVPASQISQPDAASLDVAQLQQLKQLYDEGVLTAEEFAAKKAQILGL